MTSRKAVVVCPAVILVLAALAFPAYADLPGKSSFDSDGVQIKYIDVGKGTPVVLVHGFAASALTNWARVIPELAREHRVIALDNRGHGGSGKPMGEENYGDAMIEDIVRLLNHLYVKKAHIVGYSMGGYITAKMVTMHPDRMLSATIAGAGWGKEKSIREATLDELANSIDQKHSVAPLLKKLNPGDKALPNIEAKVVDFFIMFSNEPDALACVARGMKQHTVTQEQIEAIDIPVQLIVGSEDPIRKAAEAWVAIRPDHECIVIDGSNHATTIARPEFVDAIERFIDTVDR